MEDMNWPKGLNSINQNYKDSPPTP